jgi:non-specific protein-tyrosine kinase
MNTPSFSEDIRRILGQVARWAWLLALAALLGGSGAFLISRQMQPVYRASTTLLINEAPATKTTDYSSVLTSERLAQTYAQLLSKRPVLERVIERLNLDREPADLKKAILVQPVRDTQLIVLQVEDTSPQRAADIANALVEEFAAQNAQNQAARYAAPKQSLEALLAQMDRQIQENNAALAALEEDSENRAERDRLETNRVQYGQTYAYLLQSYEQVRLAEAQSTSNVVQAEAATPPRAPVRPRTLTNTVAAGVLGLVFGAGLAFLIETLDDTLRSPEEVTRELGLPILGVIARIAYKQETPVTLAEPRSPVSEAFRALRTNIQFASVDRPLHALLVTSPSPAEGKSSISANLAVVMAQNERRVILLEGDLRRPRTHELFDVTNWLGLSDLFVRAHIDLDGTVKKTGLVGLSILTSGGLPPNPSELLGSEKMVGILTKLKEQADFVVIDSPPVLAVTDAAVLAPRVDGVILVVKPGVTKLAASKQAVEQLRRVGANLVGVVLNEVEFKRSRYAYYHYRGYYTTYYERGENAVNGKAAKNGLRKGEKASTP